MKNEIKNQLGHTDSPCKDDNPAAQCAPDADQQVNLGTTINYTGLHKPGLTDYEQTEVLQTQLASLWSESHEALVSLDLQDRIMGVNREFTRLFGYTSDEAVGRSINDLIVPPELQETAINYSQATAKGERVESASVRRRKDGSMVDVSVMGVPIMHQGRQVSIFGIYRDISRQKEMEKALKASERQFRSLSENAPEIIYSLDLQGQIIFVNPAWNRSLGHDHQAIIGKRLADFARPEDAPGLDRHLARIIRNQQTAKINLPLLHSDGSLRYFTLSGAPNLNHGGDISGVVGMIQNITEQVKTERALRESRARHRAALDGSPDPVMIYNKNGLITYVNPAFSRVFGWSPREINGGKLDFIPASLQQESKELIKKVLAGENLEGFRTKRLSKDGEAVVVSVSASRYQGLRQEAMGCIFTLRDITRRIEAEQALRKSQTSLARAQQMARLGNWELDYERALLTCSDEICRIYGMPGEHLPPNLDDFLERVHPDDRGLVQKSIEDALLLGQQENVEYRIILPDGSTRILQQIAEKVPGAQNGSKMLMAVVQDITERRESEEQTRLLARVFENTIEGILVTDKSGVIQMVNQSFTHITGYSAEEVLGHKPSVLNSGRHNEGFFKKIWKSLQERGQWQGEIWNRRKNGDAFPEWLAITAIRDASGRVTHYVGVFHDITENKAYEDQIAQQAYHDALTSLPNRLLFHDRLNMAMAHAQRTKGGLAILFLDLDNFKNINDSLGHAAGDQLLQEVAARLLNLLRDEDTVARLGGDEFVMLLQGSDDPDYAVQVARRILSSITKPFHIKDQELYITASMGITMYPHDGADRETLISNADIAMYRAKEEGKNSYKLFTPSMNTLVVERLELEGSLRKAVANQEFELYYQPKVSLESHRVVGVEALVRWMRPGVGLVSPDDFIPVAEETGLIVPLGEWVLRTACTQAKQWHQEGFGHMHVAVNLSPRQFKQKNLVETVERILAETGLPAEFLELEITENVVMHDVEEAIKTLARLSNLGVRLALDDFGRGYSSLYYLKRFPMNSLKIDRSFVTDIIKDADDASIVNTIISMSKNLNLKVVAEGVETNEQLGFLKKQRCNEMQGYLFSKPVPHADLTEILRKGVTLQYQPK